MRETFSTEHPPFLYLELRSGDVSLTTAETDQTEVVVEGDGADDPGMVVVEQRGDNIVVLGQSHRHSLFGSDRHRLSVRVTAPHESRLTSRLGSADLQVTGRVGETSVKAGSGDVRIDTIDSDAVVETGSGEVTIDAVRGDLRVKCGSGDVRLGELGGRAQVTTGSGDVSVSTASAALRVKSGSGDLRVRESSSPDLSLSSASGDLVVDALHGGRLMAKNASGDIVVGIPAGIPVWTDVSSASGSIRSDLDGAGAPEEGQDHIEVQARSVSGDVQLKQL